MVDGRTEKPHPDITTAGSMVPSDGGQGREEDFKKRDVSDDVSGRGETAPSRKSARVGSGDDHQDRKEVEKAGQQEMGGRGPQGGTGVCVANESGPAIDRGHRTSAVDQVLLDQDLLGGVISCLVGGHARQDVRVLGPLSLVCRMWREVAAWEAWWDRIEAEMLPGVRTDWGLDEASSRDRVAQYGGVLWMQRHSLPEQYTRLNEWLRRLEAHVEIFDSMDGLQMLSLGGPIKLDYSGGRAFMRIPSESATVKDSTPFSAASRDPLLRRFSSMLHYLQVGDEEEYPCCLAMRVTLRDPETEAEALIYESDDRTVRPAREIQIYRFGNHNGPLEATCKTDRINPVGRLVLPEASFAVTPLGGQGKDVAKQDRLFHIDPNHILGFKLSFDHVSPYWTREAAWAQLDVALQSALGRTGQALDSGDEWLQRLEAHVEVFDRMDGLQMLSLRGGVEFDRDTGIGEVVVAYITLPESATSSTHFSAASRDPAGRFSTISEYFERGHEEEYPCNLCTRVTLRDTETGKVALICDEDKFTPRYATAFEDGDGALMVCSYGDEEEISAVGGLASVTSLFVVLPVPGQDNDISEQDRLYHLDMWFRLKLDLRVEEYDPDQDGRRGGSVKHFETGLEIALGRLEESSSAMTMLSLSALHDRTTQVAGK